MTTPATLDLFANPSAQRSARALARRDDAQTSKDAGQKAVDTFVASHEGKCFGAICDAGLRGATFKEIAKATGLQDVAVARRLGGMGKRGLIKRRVLANGIAFEARDGCAIWWAA